MRTALFDPANSRGARRERPGEAEITEAIGAALESVC